MDGTFGYATQPEPEPINGKLVQNLLVEDRENAADWSIGYDFAEGSLLYGDRDITCASLPEEFASAEYIRTACVSKLSTENLGTFTVAQDMVVYIAVDTRVVEISLAWLADWRFGLSDDILK